MKIDAKLLSGYSAAASAGFAGIANAAVVELDSFIYSGLYGDMSDPVEIDGATPVTFDADDFTNSNQYTLQFDDPDNTGSERRVINLSLGTTWLNFTGRQWGGSQNASSASSMINGFYGGLLEAGDPIGYKVFLDNNEAEAARNDIPSFEKNYAGSYTSIWPEKLSDDENYTRRGYVGFADCSAYNSATCEDPNGQSYITGWLDIEITVTDGLFTAMSIHDARAFFFYGGAGSDTELFSVDDYARVEAGGGITPVPIPAALPLMAAGFGGLAGLRAMRKRRARAKLQ